MNNISSTAVYDSGTNDTSHLDGQMVDSAHSCYDGHIYRADISLIMLGPSTFIQLVLMFVKRRASFKKDCCHGRPGVIHPINFIDEVGRRWAFVASFAVMMTYILDFFDQKLFWNPGNWNDPEWVLRFGWIKAFILMGNVIHLGYLFFPLFACISMRRHIPANLLGAAYVSVWIWIDLLYYLECPLDRDPVTGSLTALEITKIVLDLPVFIGTVALALCFVGDLMINIYILYKRRRGYTGTIYASQKSKKTADEYEGKATLPLKYIQYMLTTKKIEPQNLREKLKFMFRYSEVIGFKYPPRVVCTMAVAAMGVYSLAVYLGVLFDELLRPLEQYGHEIGEVVGTIQAIFMDYEVTSASTVMVVTRYLSGLRWSLIVANVVSSVFHAATMVHMIIVYRRHVRMVMRGDRSWHFTYDKSPASSLVGGMRYSGYQIAYMLWGYIIMYILVALVCIAIAALIIIPLSFGHRSWAIDRIITLAPTIIIGLLLTLIQVILCKFAFLQERGKYLALNNRLVYHCVSFYIFFFNIVLGVFSVLKRSLLSLVFGTILLSRLDRCLLMRGFERFDAGFNSYLAMLEVDVHHNHPILKGFIYILQDEVRDSKRRQKLNLRDVELGEKKDADKGDGRHTRSEGGHLFDKRIRNKWWKLITLVHNPSLIIERLHKRVIDEKRKGRDGANLADLIAQTSTVLPEEKINQGEIKRRDGVDTDGKITEMDGSQKNGEIKRRDAEESNYEKNKRIEEDTGNNISMLVKTSTHV